MKFSCISDVHIKKTGDPASEVIQLFFSNTFVKESDAIFLLGDIFDFMIGGHKGFVKTYEFFFKELATCINNGQKIYVFEGNHDFHVEKVYNYFLEKENLDKSKFEFSRVGKNLEIDGKNIYFCHGDDLDFDNPYYQRWKKIYSSLPFKLFVEKLLPYNILMKLGEKAAGNSKRRGKKVFDYTKAQQRYRKNAMHVIQEQSCDILVFGHTHIKEEQTVNGKQYINNGFPIKDKTFVHYDGKTIGLKSLV